VAFTFCPEWNLRFDTTSVSSSCPATFVVPILRYLRLNFSKPLSQHMRIDRVLTPQTQIVSTPIFLEKDFKS
jgi:hypothetical protein